jgi:hypothetical protein
MGTEGNKSLLPATSSENTRSEVPKTYIRNVEAEGSNPFTSTGMESLVTGAFPRKSVTMDL